MFFLAPSNFLKKGTFTSCQDASKQECYFTIDFDLQCPVHQKFLVQLARINVGRRCLLTYNILSRFEDNVMLTLIRQLFLSLSHFNFMPA